MPQKKRKDEMPAAAATDKPPQTDPLQEGLPNPASVVGQQILVSPKGRKYTILKTTEVDASDKRKKRK